MFLVSVVKKTPRSALVKLSHVKSADIANRLIENARFLNLHRVLWITYLSVLRMIDIVGLPTQRFSVSSFGKY